MTFLCAFGREFDRPTGGAVRISLGAQSLGGDTAARSDARAQPHQLQTSEPRHAGEGLKILKNGAADAH